MSNIIVDVKRIFSVPAEVVYDAWLDSKAVEAFMKPADIVTVPSPEIDAKIGGKFLFNMHVGENVLPHKGEYRILDRPNKLQFTWNSMNTKNEDSIVTITIESLDDNSCELVLKHELLPTESAREDHKGGWTNITKTLDELLSK